MAGLANSFGALSVDGDGSEWATKKSKARKGVKLRGASSHPTQSASQRPLQQPHQPQLQQQQPAPPQACPALAPAAGSAPFVSPRVPVKASAELLSRYGAGPAVDTAAMACSPTMSERGVDVEWLVRWTDKHSLWGVKTEDVVEQVVKPLTAHLRCRFVELASQVEEAPPSSHGAAGLGAAPRLIVGAAHCFVSHCWQCPFGDVVAAAADNSRPGRRVWLDIFAVNQHAHEVMAADLDKLTHVIKDVPEGLMLVMEPAKALASDRLNPLRRIWCVFEIFHALDANRPLVLKLGRAAPPKPSATSITTAGAAGDAPLAAGTTGAAAAGPLAWHREWAHKQVDALAKSVDVLRADATKAEDKVTIERDLKLQRRADTVNRRITTAIWNAFTTRGQAAFHYAVQGAAALGWAVATQGVDLEARNPEGWTALHSAAYSGQAELVKALVSPVPFVEELFLADQAQARAQGQAHAVGDGPLWENVARKKGKKGGASGCGGSGSVARPFGADVNARDKKGRTPAFSAAWQGSLRPLELLVTAGCDLALCDVFGYRPLDRAVRCLEDLSGRGKATTLLKQFAGNDAARLLEQAKYTAVVRFLEAEMRRAETLDSEGVPPPGTKGTKGKRGTGGKGGKGGKGAGKRGPGGGGGGSDGGGGGGGDDDGLPLTRHLLHRSESNVSSMSFEDKDDDNDDNWEDRPVDAPVAASPRPTRLVRQASNASLMAGDVIEEAGDDCGSGSDGEDEFHDADDGSRNDDPGRGAEGGGGGGGGGSGSAVAERGKGGGSRRRKKC